MHKVIEILVYTKKLKYSSDFIKYNVMSLNTLVIKIIL